MDKVIPLNEEQLARVDAMLANVHIAIALSMSYVRKFQGWDFTQLGKRFSGISVASLRRYQQPAYTMMRPLHAVAAYSWLTMLPMPCFYRGLNIREAYPDMDDVSVECLIHSGLLPSDQFALVCAHLHHFLTTEQQDAVAVYEDSLAEQYGRLDEYQDSDFMFPEVLDLNDFGRDYYYSLAVSFKAFRKKYNIPIETMARVLNLSEYSYKQCEHPDKPVPLPVDLGARLQLGFQLPDVMPFTADMKAFPQFHTVRRVQQLRQNILVNMLTHLDDTNKKHFALIVSNLSSMYLRK